MIKSGFLIFLSVFLCHANLAYSETAKELSLREAVLLALRYNPNIQNAEIDRIIQKFDLRVAQSEFELEYALSASANHTLTKAQEVYSKTRSYKATPEVSILSPLGTRLSVGMQNNYDAEHYNPQLDFSVSQPLLRGFGVEIVRSGLNNAIDDEESNKLRLKQSVIDALTTIIIGYRNLILDNNRLRILEVQLTEAERIITTNKAKIKAGRLAPTANIQAQVQLEKLRLSYARTLRQRDQDKQIFLEDIGLDPALEVKLPNDVKIPELVAPKVEQTIAFALKNNTAYLQQLIRVTKNKRALAVAKNDQLWQLDMTLTQSLGSAAGTGPDAGIPSLFNGRNKSQSINFELSVPIDDLSRKQRLVSAKVQVDKDEIDLAATKRSLITQVKNQITEINSQIEQIKLAEKTVALAKQAYDLEKKKQDVGRASELDVVDSQDKLITAQNDFIASKISYLNAMTTLQSILGTTLETWQVEVRY